MIDNTGQDTGSATPIDTTQPSNFVDTNADAPPPASVDPTGAALINSDAIGLYDNQTVWPPLGYSQAQVIAFVQATYPNYEDLFGPNPDGSYTVRILIGNEDFKAPSGA